ncbi:hypothetical protein [Metapseudomonas furukawaii]|uniref:DUF4148 domain-containing protein n=1 Tax=Metapseudomonas furukawaii TaxID=1149133 RepID=A0AAD1C394_METFU|nr:hypothetical protein [Pseudomonas furukawaii]ELS25753.1 hypothetical protein ppKF707_1283 [Pseudomonas furukawaii]BAU75998.1 hypothetical protein KF707C_43100 [Pseudomonas furukawaii]
MKSTLDSKALGGLFLALAVTAASGAAVAENGSARVEEFRQRNLQVFQMRQDSSQDFVRMVEEQPTAAGPLYEEDVMRPSGPEKPRYQSWIHQQRVEFGK